MLGLTRQGCHKTISALLLPFLDLPDPQICLQSSISGIIWDGELVIYEFERTRGKVTANMERNISNIIQNLYASMSDRNASCICTRGDSTGY
ncbi:hypothetical protein TNCV_5045851 [Trichonephila clavipes]|uniref:Uncharacterized protein n=1 Tax=Trichonephila clavipes TaxID=2585209 RepID=A0A8X6WJE4_TRICX|nr:hypothetical protein TNCV_5045851 [Trichonephila clavipes]